MGSIPGIRWDRVRCLWQPLVAPPSICAVCEWHSTQMARQNQSSLALLSPAAESHGHCLMAAVMKTWSPDLGSAPEAPDWGSLRQGLAHSEREDWAHLQTLSSVCLLGTALLRRTPGGSWFQRRRC